MILQKEQLDFIFITQTRWDDVSSTSYSLAQEFSKNNRVFFIDKPFTYKDIITNWNTDEICFRRRTYFFGKDKYRKLDKVHKNFTLVIPSPSIPINFLPAGRLYNIGLMINQRKLESTIRLLCKKKKIKNYILFNSYNPYYSLNLQVDIIPRVKIYQSVDNIECSPYLSKHGSYLEYKIALEADIILGTSKEIIRKFKSKNFKIHYLPNAADTESFTKAYFRGENKPFELRKIKQPVIGYIGTIDERFDYDLLSELSKQHSDKVILLIGPVKRDALEFDFSKFPNIVITGLKKMSDLPVFAKFINCAIIPFKKTGFTKSIYPLKINEYLAAGKPVITTSFSEEMNDFHNIAYVAENNEHFLSLVNKALEENSSARELARIEFSRNNSWENRVAMFWEIINSYKII